jgi:hypothetical protein
VSLASSSAQSRMTSPTFSRLLGSICLPFSVTSTSVLTFAFLRDFEMKLGADSSPNFQCSQIDIASEEEEVMMSNFQRISGKPSSRVVESLEEICFNRFIKILSRDPFCQSVALVVFAYLIIRIEINI